MIPPPYQLNRESFYKMETFCMVVFGGEYVEDHTVGARLPTRLFITTVRHVGQAVLSQLWSLIPHCTLH